MIWIEMSRNNNHGGGEWGFTKCVWSPTETRNRGSKPLYWKNIMAVKPEDIVFHLKGEGRTAAFVGYSIVKSLGEKTSERPPDPDIWSYSKQFYRAFLKDYIAFSPPIDLYTLFEKKEQEFKKYSLNLKRPRNVFFRILNNKLGCSQGAYLSKADGPLIDLILGDSIDIDSKTRIKLHAETNEGERVIKSATVEKGEINLAQDENFRLFGGKKASSKHIQIISTSKEEFRNTGKDRYEIQKNYFLRTLRASGGKYYRKSNINSFEGSLFLFQYERQIIASAIFKKDVDEPHGDYSGHYQLDVDSITVFDPAITSDDLKKIVEEFNDFNRSEHTIDNKYLSRIQKLIDERDATEIFLGEENGIPRIRTRSEWSRILKDEVNENDLTIKVLICYLNSPNYEARQDEIEQMFGIKGLNSWVRQFGERIIKSTNIPRQFREKDIGLGRERFFNIPFTGKTVEGRYQWRLRPQLVEALLYLDLEEYGFVYDGSIPPGIIDATTGLRIVKWDYEQNHMPQRSGTAPKKKNYERLSKIQRDVGNTGEELVLNHEKNKLKRCGRMDLSEKVERMSKDDDSLGYDVLSFDERGNEIHIEVKTTTSPAMRLQFFISPNEVQKYFEDKNMFIYFVFDIKGDPKLHIVDRKQFLEEFLTPSQYHVNVNVSERKDLP